jgi:hypothetical protein
MATDIETDADNDALDDQALAMRSNGSSFRKIAHELGFLRASDANVAFNRALRRLPEHQKDTIRVEEGRRLDRLAQVTRGNDSLTATDVDRRLKSVDRLRAQLNAD